MSFFLKENINAEFIEKLKNKDTIQITMENKKLGIILIVAAILIASSIYIAKSRDDALIKKIVKQEGTCFLEDGTCLHEDRDMTFYIAGWIFSAIIIALSLYLIFFEKSQKEILSTLEKLNKIQIV